MPIGLDFFLLEWNFYWDKDANKWAIFACCKSSQSTWYAVVLICDALSMLFLFQYKSDCKWARALLCKIKLIFDFYKFDCLRYNGIWYVSHILRFHVLFFSPHAEKMEFRLNFMKLHKHIGSNYDKK